MNLFDSFPNTCFDIPIPIILILQPAYPGRLSSAFEGMGEPLHGSTQTTGNLPIQSQEVSFPGNQMQGIFCVIL